MSQPTKPNVPPSCVDQSGAEIKYVVGETWINPVSGLEYKWDGRVWRTTGRFPFGPNPMGLLGE
jgi:hypothetical protein